MAEMTEKINIWDNITGASFIAASMYNWRIWMGQDFNFEKFRDTYLTPLNEYASTIICPRQCGYCELGNRRIVEMKDGSFEAICDEMCGKEFVIDRQETLYYTIKESTLVLAIAKVMGITPYTAKLEKPDSSWKVGSINVKGENVQVFLMLKWQDRYLLELIFNLNRIMHDKYVLLGTKQSIISHGLTDLLHDGGGTFIPLNETLDFNDDAELELIRPFSWEKLLLSQEALNEEPENIFRKCGDAWEVRFDGGEKFLLTGVDTGARYLHYLLNNPDGVLTAFEIINKFSLEPANIMELDLLDDPDDFLSGYTVGSSPNLTSIPIADRQAIKKYRSELKLLYEEKEKAVSSGNNVKAVQMQKEIEAITRALKASCGPTGQLRYMHDSGTKAANALRNAINRTIDKISLHDIAFAEHLKASIKCGRVPSYAAEPLLSWSTNM